MELLVGIGLIVWVIVAIITAWYVNQASIFAERLGLDRDVVHDTFPGGYPYHREPISLRNPVPSGMTSAHAIMVGLVVAMWFVTGGLWPLLYMLCASAVLFGLVLMWLCEYNEAERRRTRELIRATPYAVNLPQGRD